MTNQNIAQNTNEVSGGSSESGSSYNGPGGSGYSKKSNFNLKNQNTQSMTNIKGMKTGWNAGTSAGTTAGSNWSSFGKQKGQTWAKAFVQEPEYLEFGGSAAGSDSSWSSGGAANSFTGATSNSHGGQSTQMTNQNIAQNTNEVSGGSSESGSSYNGPGGSGYSKKKNFNLKNQNTQSMTNIKGMKTGWNAGTSTGTTAGSNWSSFGKQKGQTWAK